VVGFGIALLVVMAMVFTCGLVLGVLVTRKNGRTPPAASPVSDLPDHIYEHVRPKMEERWSVSLKENAAYQHFGAHP
jgi:hypothetical protein